MMRRRRQQSLRLRGRLTFSLFMNHWLSCMRYRKSGKGGVNGREVDLVVDLPYVVDLGQVLDQLVLVPDAEVVDPVAVQMVEVQVPDERA